MNSLIEVLNTMTTHYHVSANMAAMDCGGEYDYEIFMELKKKAIRLRSQFEQIDTSLDQLAVYVQLCNLHGAKVDVDFDSLEMILSDYYNIQDKHYKLAKSNMNKAVTMLKYIQNAEKFNKQCGGDRSE